MFVSAALAWLLLTAAEVELFGEEVRWMLMPDGRGDVQVAVLEGLQPRRAAHVDEVEFLLYSRENREPERRRLNDTYRPRFEHFNPSRPSVVLIHGFGDSAKDSYMYPVLTDAFLEHGDYNVLAVDWSSLAAAPWYLTAATNTGRVARHVATLLDHMVRTAGADLDDFHLMGFSLGAHVAGLTGQFVSSGRVKRITGLDPAQVLFKAVGPEWRLDASDAELVEVVHTSGGYLGFLAPMGHRDYFPNGGAWPQPGCVLDFVGVCSHRRAYYYYGEALLSGEGFRAVACPSWELFQEGSCSTDGPSLPLAMGDYPDSSIQGAFFLDTNPQPPFGRPPPPVPMSSPLAHLYNVFSGA